MLVRTAGDAPLTIVGAAEILTANHTVPDYHIAETCPQTTHVDYEFEAEVARQIEFTRALHASHTGDSTQAEKLLDEAAAQGRASEHRAFTDQRMRAEHDAVIATCDTAIMDVFANRLTAENRHDEAISFWNRRIQAAKDPTTPNVRIRSGAVRSETTEAYTTEPESVITTLANAGIRLTADHTGTLRLHIAQGTPTAVCIYQNRTCMPLTTAEQSVNRRLPNENHMIVIVDGTLPPYGKIIERDILRMARQRSQDAPLETRHALDIAQVMEQRPAMFPAIIGYLLLN